MGGRRQAIMQGSVLFYAAVFLGIHPDTVACVLSLTLRGQTAWMPAHVDPDEMGTDVPPVAHSYLSGLGTAMAGNRLVVGSRIDGGQLSSTHTYPRRGEQQVVVFDPTSQLHWVDSDRVHSNDEVDHSQVRVIPFNTKFSANALLKGVQRHAHGCGIRLAPLSPIMREAVVCGVCNQTFSSPHEKPRTWMNHLGAAMARVQSPPKDFVCFDCAWEGLTGEESVVFR